MIRRWMLLVTVCIAAGAETFPVVQHKTLWPDADGRVEITVDGVTFMANDEDDTDENREWSWLDIQYFDRISPTEFAVLTYEDQKWLLGRDHEHRFTITDGELTDELLAIISAGLGRPLTNRVVPEPLEATYTVPVKHLHTLGGCEGELHFAEDTIYYRTEEEEDSREWLLGRDVQSVWSSDPYELQIHVYDNNRREFSRTRVFRFDLKQRLDPETYRSLKLKLYDLDETHLGGR